MAINPEGAVSAHVTDATKIQCPRCDGVEIMLSNLMDDPGDIDDDRFQALYIMSDLPIMGLVGLCVHCGKEWVPYWWTIDIGASDGTAITMTGFDTDRAANATADLLAGLYMIYIGADANDLKEYFVINTNTAADPAVITPVVAPNAATDGMFIITNILPLGLTPAA